MSEEFLQVGKIVNTHGVNGEVRVIRMTDFPERFNVGNTLYVQKNGETIPLKIKSHRTHKQFDLLQFEGYDEMESVKQLMQLHLHIKKSQLTPLPEGQYYYYEIIGCEVMTIDGEIIGVVDHILAPGANDVWVVKRKNGQEALIPYIKDVVKKIDIVNKVITIELMEGLLD
ncbi:MAG TPA: ribosome maturation factor RimM [Bacillota bacterium]|nr:ribosome maturation factor RimM [Bacillota bacterium]